MEKSLTITMDNDIQGNIHIYRQSRNFSAMGFFTLKFMKLAITKHERTTTAKNMGILKYHPTSLISYERGWPLVCLEDLIKPNQASHQGAR
jgi:hypothetical protein